MPDILPKSKVAPTRINPKIGIIYSLPKVGKTTMLSQLEDCMILDTEGGADMYEALRLRITSVYGQSSYNDDGTIKSTSIDAFEKMMFADAERQIKEGIKVPKFPYRFIAVDTLDELESMCEISATKKFFESTIGKGVKQKNPDMKSVLELPNGGGYYHLRNEVMLQIDRLVRLCPHLILISHIKDKLLEKGGIEISVKDISLTGKLGSIVAAKADYIGYVYREPKKPLMISFESYENTSVMGARFPRLAGKKMEFTWSNIYLPEPAQVATV